jgi:hypothetical protein
MNEPLVRNPRVKSARLAAGFRTAREFAARAEIDPAWYDKIEAGLVLPSAEELERITGRLGGIDGLRLYDLADLGMIAGYGPGGGGDYNPASMWHDLAEHCHMLLARDEVTWFERRPQVDHPVDVFLNLSCGTQMIPNVLLDTVSVFDRLGVRFVAAAGAAACCGKPFNNIGQAAKFERFHRTRLERTAGWGAHTHVNWCTACQGTSTAEAARRLHTEGVEHPVREVQVLTFLTERLRELGQSVPWRQEVSYRVLVEGHPGFGGTLPEAQRAAARLLSLVPGVEVVDTYDGYSDLSVCSVRARGADWTPPEWVARQDTADGIREHRDRLADHVADLGADTVSCQHQGCHFLWSRYASDRLAVRHAVSIVAEALGCAHPDRYQVAVRLGDPAEFVAQTRPVWQSWDIGEADALRLAEKISDPKFGADEVGELNCGPGERRAHFVGIDVLAGGLREAGG